MRTIETDNPVAWCVCQSVCNALAPCKTVERIKVLVKVETPGDLRNIVLDGDHPRRGEEVRYILQYYAKFL